MLGPRLTCPNLHSCDRGWHMTVVFSVRTQVMVGSRLMRAERWFLYALIPLTLALSVAGVYSSVAELVDKVRNQ